MKCIHCAKELYYLQLAGTSKSKLTRCDNGDQQCTENPTGHEVTVLEAQIEPESILQEAHRLTHGDRNKSYGHPHDDYSRTAGMVNALLKHKLKEPLTAAECAMIMCCVKLSRQAHSPKRDNMVDLAGYAWVADACKEKEKEIAGKALNQFESAPTPDACTECKQTMYGRIAGTDTKVCLNCGHRW